MLTPRSRIETTDSAYALIQRLLDTLSIGVAGRIACSLTSGTWDSAESLAAAVGAVLFYLAGEANGLYRAPEGRGPDLRTSRGEYLQVLVIWGFAVSALLTLAFVFKVSSDFSRLAALTWFLAAPTLMVSFRLALRAVAAELRRRGKYARNVAIVGSTTTGHALGERIKADRTLGLQLVGFYDDRVAPERRAVADAVAPFLGCTRTLVEHARQGRVDTVYIALPLRAEPRINALLHLLADTTASVHVLAEFSIFRPRHGCWASVGDVPVLRVFDTPFSGVGAQVKRVEDIVLSAATLSVLCIPMLIIALLIKLSSRGKVFSSQRRPGFNGSAIHCLTFRTRESSKRVEASRASADAPSSIRLGGLPLGEFLRNTSLDELPQLLSVLLGDISIVGPSRFPSAPSGKYGAEIQGYLSRHRVKPGLTGWAQVNVRGCDSAENANLRAQHDLDYIRNWRLLWDFEIMFRAIFGAGNQGTRLECQSGRKNQLGAVVRPKVGARSRTAEGSRAPGNSAGRARRSILRRVHTL